MILDTTTVTSRIVERRKYHLTSNRSTHQLMDLKSNYLLFHLCHENEPTCTIALT
jgi:hypothetical protein